MGTQSKMKTRRLAHEAVTETMAAMYMGNRKQRRTATSKLRRDAAVKSKDARNLVAGKSAVAIDEMYKELTSQCQETTPIVPSKPCVDAQLPTTPLTGTANESSD